MKRKLSIKNTILGGTIGIFILFVYTEIYARKNGRRDIVVKYKKNERRIASIDGHELDEVLKSAAKKIYDIEKLDHLKFNIYNESKILLLRQGGGTNLLKKGKISGSYASRTLIEDIKLPEKWSLTPDLEKTLADRKNHVKEICHKNGLDIRKDSNQPNSWEYMVSEKYNLAWCPIFKAASSSWMFNFNLLAGYTENFLYSAKNTPVALARKIYPRLKTEQLDEIMGGSTRPLTFMITRHPFERLVSAFRDKILSGNAYFKTLYADIARRYPHLADEPGEKDIEKMRDPLQRAKMRRKNSRMKIPSFRQFVQYLIDETQKGNALNEHWTPMNKFCTPCLVHIDVFAKFETLLRDGNYVIFSSGIEKVIKPKMINRSKKGPTNDVAAQYLCQLSAAQQAGLEELYKLDLELFQYEYKHYFNCSNVML